ncbi:MAG: erythromycin esterase family protein [Verrucomicrobia bacterium]|nr:erythromycin esterase family protein [Verrucomicrobiota bacterium]
MNAIAELPLKNLVKDSAHPLREGEISDYDPLLDLVGDAHFVLLGEASHGTHEFYRERAQITKRLIREKGFTAVAVEADFPDANRVNRFVRGMGNDVDAIDCLGGFKRFPAWMWRNADVLDFIGWLREHNDHLRDDSSKTGFYGLDLYSMNSSIEAVLSYLDKIDPEAARRARERYACFDCFGGDTQKYGYETALGHGYSCEDAVVSQFVEIYSRSAELAKLDGRVAADDFFVAEQNARLVKNAEQYYRTMYRSNVSSWNLRDSHMMETLLELGNHLTHKGKPPKMVVWEHNSHLGDARATRMGQKGEWNVGQLIRQKFENEAVLVGFTTHHGTVTASSDWGGQAERKHVRPALHGSYEALFHQVGLKRFLLLLREEGRLKSALRQPLLERAIGVIYRPESERLSHYFHAMLSEQFDAVIHIDETRAVEPLERTSTWDIGEAPETFPSGI